jgi:hypothetical protein
MAGQKASAVTGPTPGIVISLQPAASSRVARMTKRCRRSRLSSSASRTCSSGSITTARRAHSPWRSSAQSPGADRGMPPDQVRGRLLSISRSLPSRSARAVRSGRSSWESSDFTCAGRDPGSAGADPSASCKEYGRQTAEAHLGNGLRFGSTRSSTAWSGPPLATAGAPTARPTTRRPQPGMEPRRHQSGLQTNAAERQDHSHQSRRERPWLTGRFQFPPHGFGTVDNADAARLQQDVDPGIMDHLGASLG